MSSKWVWPFELLDKLGEGGMGVVYRGRYVGNNRIVAVKLLPDEVAANENLVARFDRELEILKQLKHPHIVNCFGGVCESKQRFYAMELLEGGTLADLLHKRGRVTWDHVIEYGLQMCSALDYAHARGVIHRDIKPGNFLLTKSGQIKLSDFGLATMVAATRITRAGKTAGTFQYMAPEQIQGRPPISNKTDLYALGCVLFELLSGRTPFEAETPAAVLHLHLKQEPPRVSTLCRDVPPELDQLIAELLSKNPDDRPENALVVSQRLDSILRPSRAGFDPFAHTAHDYDSPSSTPVVTADDDEEVAEKAQLAPHHRQWLCAAWSTCVVLLMLFLWQWRQASYWKQDAQAWETARVAAIASTEPGQQMAAIAEFGQHGPMSSSAEAAVVQALQSSLPTVRQTALKAIERQPGNLREHVTLVRRLQQQDENADVRAQAEKTAEALRRAPSMGLGGLLGKTLLVLLTLAVASAPWFVWERPKALMRSPIVRAAVPALSSSRRPVTKL
ncbi:MAG TPA: protein kinase [Planctomycetaceae bacterium]|nr:protein kinase [Planctomycetaceae bacterium]